MTENDARSARELVDAIQVELEYARDDCWFAKEEFWLMCDEEIIKQTTAEIEKYGINIDRDTPAGRYLAETVYRAQVLSNLTAKLLGEIEDWESETKARKRIQKVYSVIPKSHSASI